MTLEELARTRPFARTPVVPQWTLGTFRRRSITYADGAEDATTAVVWIQSHGLTGDIRIPADRPDVRHRGGLADCTREELLGLAMAEGGVAETSYADGLMRWTDWSAFQPMNNWPEPGDLRRVGACMVEFAPSGAYVEDWRFEPAASPLRVGLRLLGEQAEGGPVRPRSGGLTVAGDLAIFSLARRAPLPAAHLADQFRASTDLPCLTQIAFDAETSLARGAERAFQVELSTNPFLQRAPLDLGEFLPGVETGTLLEDLGDRRRIWRIDTLTI